jgi:replicative DNA helicase
MAAEPLLDKVPPHSIEAEMAVLGAIMQSPEAFGIAIQHLAADDFYRQDHRTLYEALVAMYDAGKPIDFVSVREHLASHNRLDAVGGDAYIVDLVEAVPTVANAEHYAKIVKEKALLRGLIQAGAEIIRDAHDQANVEEVLDRCERRIFEVTERNIVGQAYDVRRILSEVMQKLDLQGGHTITGLETGLADLDDKTRGFQPGEMIVLAARPSVGKSALALNIAEHVAVDLGKPVIFFSIEMSKEELALRLAASRAEVDGQKLRKGQLSDAEVRRMQDTCHFLYSAPLFIDETPSLRILDLRAKARRMVQRHNVELIVVDYLQLMTAPGAESRQVEVSSISRGLKAIARELNLPVVAIAQLRRESEEHKRPRLSDLRESGAIEQDADVVLLLHREEMRHSHDSKEYAESQGKAELIIAKQRNGPTDTINLTWQRQYTRFRSWTPHEEPVGRPVEDRAAPASRFEQPGAEVAADSDDGGEAAPPF